MRLVIHLMCLLWIAAIAACSPASVSEPVPVPLPERVTEGMNNVRYSQSLHEGGFEKAPPPPPVQEDFGDHNFFETEEGKVYYFRLIRDPRMNDKVSEERIALRCQMWGRSSRLVQVRPDNLDFILHKGIRSLQVSHRYVSIGIYRDSTDNPLIRELVQRMQQYNREINWKVRLTCPHENLISTSRISSPW